MNLHMHELAMLCGSINGAVPINGIVQTNPNPNPNPKIRFI